MSVIAVYSIKGGVGKTTTAFELACRSAAAGHRTLLWDLDLQGGAGFLLGQPVQKIPRAVAVFRRGGKLRQQVQETPFPNLFLLPADESLRILPNALAQLGERERLTSLTHLLAGEFPRIILDCPPAMNEVSDQIIGAADLIVLPLPPSPLAMRAIETVREELLHNHPNPPPLLPMLSMLDTRRTLHREVLAGEAAGWPAIPFASAIEQIAARRAPIDSFAKSSKGAKAFAALYLRVEECLAEAKASRPAKAAPPPLPMAPQRTPPRAASHSWHSPPPESRFIRGLRWLLRV